MFTPLLMGIAIAGIILVIGAVGAHSKRQDDKYAAEDEEAMAEWEMHTAIALDDE